MLKYFFRGYNKSIDQSNIEAAFKNKKIKLKLQKAATKNASITFEGPNQASAQSNIRLSRGKATPFICKKVKTRENSGKKKLPSCFYEADNGESTTNGTSVYNHPNSDIKFNIKIDKKPQSKR